MKPNPIINQLLDNSPAEKFFTYDIIDELYHHKIVATDPCAAVWQFLGTDLEKYDMGDLPMGAICELRVTEEEDSENRECGTITLLSDGDGRVADWQWKLI